MKLKKKINPKRRKLKKKNRSRSAFRATVSDKSKSTLNVFFALFAVGAEIQMINSENVSLHPLVQAPGREAF